MPMSNLSRTEWGSRGWRLGGVIALIILMSGAVLVSLGQLHEEAQEAVLTEYGEQQRLLAEQSSLRLADLGKRVRAATGPSCGTPVWT